MSPIWLYQNETQSRLPMADLYSTRTAEDSQRCARTRVRALWLAASLLAPLRSNAVATTKVWR